jgi:sterol desaturase/sphingolipid hydroxylase (fatty acid hydroxylase superfamily)
VSYIVLAIPVFFLLIAVELLVTWLQEKDYYRLDDSTSDLACGIVDQLLEVFAKTALFAAYLSLYERARVATLPPSSSGVWLACFLGVDFLYYWFHRKSHELNAFWAAHVVHHQSEEYNLTVALRQGAFQGFFSWIFYLPLALLGFPPLVFLTVSSFNTLYQFWIHTRTIGRLGPLEWVLNTPSNHRVHHGRNPKYIDRNHGGSLIVWDRLFGTYQREEEEPVYGITTPLRSWNPLWANLSHWAYLFGKIRQAASAPDKLRFFVKPPGWQPAAMGGFQLAPEVDRASYRKFETPVSRPRALYVLLQFLAVLVASALLLNAQDRIPRAALAAASALIVWSLVTFAAILEGRRWAAGGEILRAATLVLLAVVYVTRSSQ